MPYSATLHTNTLTMYFFNWTLRDPHSTNITSYFLLNDSLTNAIWCLASYIHFCNLQSTYFKDHRTAVHTVSSSQSLTSIRIYQKWNGTSTSIEKRMFLNKTENDLPKQITDTETMDLNYKTEMKLIQVWLYWNCYCFNLLIPIHLCSSVFLATDYYSRRARTFMEKPDSTFLSYKDSAIQWAGGI